MYKGYWLNGQQVESDPGAVFTKSAKTTASIQMSRASIPKADKNYYMTMDAKQFSQPMDRINPRP